jgi:hypothetical protein
MLRRAGAVLPLPRGIRWLPGANLNAPEDAGFGFIVGSRITADGRAPLKKTRFLKVTDAAIEPGQVTIDRARQLAGPKGYVTNLPAVACGRRRAAKRGGDR